MRELSNLEQRVSKLHKTGRQKEAIPLALRSLQDRKKQFGADSLEVAEKLTELSDLYRAIGRFPRARDALSQSLHIMERVRGSFDPDVGAMLLSLGQIYQVEKNYVAAEPLYRRALNIAERTHGKNHAHTGVALENLTAWHEDTGDIPSAIALGRRALIIKQKTKGLKDHDLCSSMNKLAVLYQKQEHYEQAKRLLTRSLRIMQNKRRPDATTLADTLYLLGTVHFDMGEFLRAKERFEESLKLLEKIYGKHDAALCPSIEALAEAHYSMGAYEEAQALHQRALPIKERCFGETHQNVADSLNRLADVSQAMGLYEEAESFHRQSLTMRERTLGHRHVMVGNSCNNLGLFYLAMGDLHRSRQSFCRALRIQKPIYGRDHTEVATIYHNLALVFRPLGRSKRARVLAEYALRIRERILGKDHPMVADSLVLLAGLCGQQKEYGQAEVMYRRAMKISSRTKGPKHLDISRMSNALGIVYRNQGDHSRAKRYLHRSVNILQEVLGKDHPDGRFPLNNLAAFYRNSGEFKKALTYFMRGMDIENTYVEHVFRTATTEQQQLQCILSLGQNYDAALSLVVRKFREVPKVIRAGWEWTLLRKGIIWDAAATKKRLRRHHSPSTEIKLSTLQTLLSKQCQLLLEPQDRFQKEWQSNRTRHRILQKEIERTERQLKAEGVHTEDLPKRDRIDFQALCRVMPKETALVEYVKIVDWDLEGRRTGCSRYVAFVVSAQHQLHLFDLGIDREIESQVTKVLRSIQDELHADVHEANSPATRHFQASLEKLHHLLWHPLKDFLGVAKNVFICPDGLLNVVPFSALMDADGKTLIHQRQIAYLTSGRELLARGRKPSAPAMELLLVANPDFGEGKKFSPLPGTAYEARCIPTFLPGTRDQKIVLQKKRATKHAIIKAKVPRVMHLATHGFFLDEDLLALGDQYEKLLLRSGLVFAGANRRYHTTPIQGGDGHLTALEVTGMDLHGTELVVLSACSTGIGEVVNGEGVFGLRRAFSLTGAKNLMMSLWNITDEDAPNQIVSFYKHFQHLPPAMALHQAQLESISSLQDEMGHAPVSLWAPFIMQGASAFDKV